MQEIKIGSRWEGGEYQTFEVTALEPCAEQPLETWVCYRSPQTGQEYRCWMASFLRRFKPQTQ